MRSVSSTFSVVNVFLILAFSLSSQNVSLNSGQTYNPLLVSALPTDPTIKKIAIENGGVDLKQTARISLKAAQKPTVHVTELNARHKRRVYLKAQPLAVERPASISKRRLHLNIQTGHNLEADNGAQSPPEREPLFFKRPPRTFTTAPTTSPSLPSSPGYRATFPLGLSGDPCDQYNPCLRDRLCLDVSWVVARPPRFARCDPKLSRSCLCVPPTLHGTCASSARCGPRERCVRWRDRAREGDRPFCWSCATAARLNVFDFVDMTSNCDRWPTPSLRPGPPPRPTPSRSPTPSVTPSNRPTPSVSPSASTSAVPKPTPSVTPTPSTTPSPSPTPSPTPTPSKTPSPSPRPPAPLQLFTPRPTPPSSEPPAPCIAVHHLAHLAPEQLVFRAHRTADVLCTSEGSCATSGHIVEVQGWGAMTMGTFCTRQKTCVARRMLVNNPRMMRISASATETQRSSSRSTTNSSDRRSSIGILDGDRRGEQRATTIRAITTETARRRIGTTTHSISTLAAMPTSISEWWHRLRLRRTALAGLGPWGEMPVRVPSNTTGLAFTPFSARYGSRLEEWALRALVWAGW